MSDTLRLKATDRILVFAPHPDDESIACGGLLLAACDADATRRVVMVTDGDNNPWPQRWIEKHWRIDAAARARWGARRRAEAQAAMDLLHVNEAERFFFGLPDTSLTDLLMRDGANFVRRLREQIASFRPTHIALPVLEDIHPDHSALHIAVRLALLGDVDSAAQLLGFSVHGEANADERIDVPLSNEQQIDKRNAILRHETQTRLSGSRFLAFSRATETYRTQIFPPKPRVDHPLRCRLRTDNNTLELAIDLRPLRRSVSNQQLLLLIDSAYGEQLRWRISLANTHRICEILDARDARVVATSTWQLDKHLLKTVFPVQVASPAIVGFAKLARRRPGLVIYDRFGWQNIGM